MKRFRNLNEVFKVYPNAKAVIGGNGYNRESWGDDLKIYIEKIGFDPVKSIVLDGSNSTSMRVVRNEKVYWYGSPSHDTYIGNMGSTGLNNIQ
ncbi:hypothetical protein AF2641_08620 [Anoxybacillus flavithermus]|nr:hypothetical protein AF2641_08620 [Anoxybacillus flavithermus]